MCVWYVSQVEKYIGKQGMIAVKAPSLVEPCPIEAAVIKLAREQLRESMPWLVSYVLVSFQKYIMGIRSNVLEKLSKRARSSRSSCLLTVNVIHGGIPTAHVRKSAGFDHKHRFISHPEANGKAVIHP